LPHIALSAVAALLLILTGAPSVQAAGETVVSPGNPQGWVTQQETPNGEARFAAGPATPPAGSGSLRLKTDATGAVVAQTQTYAGTRLDALDALSYHTYRVSGDADRTIALVLWIDNDDTDGDDSAKAQAIFQPGLTDTIDNNQWQGPWDAGVAKGWIVEPVGPTGCTAATPCTLAELLTALPDAAIAGDGGRVALRAAGSGGIGMEAFADKLTISESGTAITFDFEAEQCTTTCYVDSVSGDDTFSGKTPSEPKRTIGAAVAQVSAGGEVIVASGFYPESAIVLDKAVSVIGVSRLNTLVDGGGSDIFVVRSGDVALEGLTLQNGTRGVRVVQAATPINGVTLSALRVRNQSVAGVEVSANTSVAGLAISDSLLLNNAIGVKLETTAKVNGLTILRSAVDGAATGLQQTNGGVDGALRNLLIDQTSFSDNTAAAISVEELANATIKASTFEGNGKGIVVDKRFATSGQNAGDITIRDNTFQGQKNASIEIGIRGSGLSEPLAIEDNEFSQAVTLLSATTALVKVQLGTGAAHAAVAVSGNRFTLSGVRPGGVAAVHGLQLGGSLDEVMVSQNTFVGGSVGSAVDTPATSAVYVQSNDATFGALDAATVIDIQRNDIGGFENGIAVYDSVAQEYGGLAADASVTAQGNNLTGNAQFGAIGGAGGPLLALRNWWGSASGPAGAGPGSGDAVSANVIYCPWLDGPAPDGSPVTASGGFATTSTDNHQTQYCTIEEALFASQGAAQTVLVSEGIWPPEAFGRNYADSPGVTIRSASARADTILTGVTLTGATFDGLTFDSLTLTGSAGSPEKPYAVVIDWTGSYTGLTLTNNLFDGGNLANRGAIFVNSPADDTLIANNRFENYATTQSGVQALIMVSTEGGDTGTGLTIRDNEFPSLPHQKAVNVFRWGDTTIQGNQIQGARVTVAAPIGVSSSSLGLTQVISNQLALEGDAIGIELLNLNATAAVEENRISGAQTCVDARGVATLQMSDNTLTTCSARGLLFGAADITPVSATIESNTFISGPVGIENISSLTLDVCNNFFQNVATTTIANPGAFTACPVIIEKFEDLNRNGERDEGEPGLAGWEFTVTQDEQTIATATTDASGVITLPDLEPGDYEVCETLQPGWINTTDLCQPLTAGPGRANLLRFGNVMTGRIVISKAANPADGSAFDFGTNIPGAEGGFTLYGLPEESAEISVTLPISASNIITFENVPTGVFTVTELIPERWMLTELTCVDPTDDTVVNLDRAAARIAVTNGETVACTYRNEAAAGIAIVKETRPGGLVGPFVFEGDLQGSISHGGRIARSGIPPGDYQVREAALPTGFSLNEIRCDDENSSGDLATRTANFTVEPGEFVTCTFVNTLVGIDVTPAVRVSEEGEIGVYNITLAVAPRAPVTISIVPDEQVTTSPQVVVATPADWNAPHLVTVAAVDDGEVESPPGTVHAGLIRHEVTSEDPYYDGIAMRDVVVAIVDNDYPGVIVAPTQLALVDATEPMTYSIQLASRPGDAVAIGIEPGAGLETLPTALLFTPDNWNDPQAVLVLIDSPESFVLGEILHTVRSTDSIYDGIDASSVVVTQDRLNPRLYLPLIAK
jgi:hypothetical protein